jgi:ubiquinone/menaquinone biosynthesis C-methylase UbiE
MVHANMQGISHVKNFAHPKSNVDALPIEHGMSVADFGAGSGHYVFHMAEALEGSGHVFAIDVQRDLLRRIKNEADKKGLQNVDVLWGDLEQRGGSKLGDHSQDLVLISNLLFQVPDKLTPLREAWRILKQTGYLAIIDWSDPESAIGPHRRDVVQKQTALDLARAAGFEFIRDFAAGAHHYGLLLRPVRLVV